MLPVEAAVLYRVQVEHVVMTMEGVRTEHQSRALQQADTIRVTALPVLDWIAQAAEQGQQARAVRLAVDAQSLRRMVVLEFILVTERLAAERIVQSLFKALVVMARIALLRMAVVAAERSKVAELIVIRAYVMIHLSLMELVVSRQRLYARLQQWVAVAGFTLVTLLDASQLVVASMPSAVRQLIGVGVKQVIRLIHRQREGAVRTVILFALPVTILRVEIGIAVAVTLIHRSDMYALNL